MSTNSLNLFHPFTENWFSHALGEPTAVQESAWPAIAAGKHTLVSAPTGTGKTLSAFLVFIDDLKERARNGTLKQEVHLIYISPLKSLAGDIRENLRRPLDGIGEEERNAGVLSNDETTHLNVAIRTGDTPQSERRKMIKRPPHILITTPESFYLMLTSLSGKSILRTARAIIIDELHSLINSKRGAHLMLSIARLDALCPKPLQRIGLSATIEPLNLAAEYLSPEPVTIAAPKMHKRIKLTITSPFSNSETLYREPVWQEIAATVYAHCTGTRSVIAFVELRAYAEKLAYFVNQLGGDGFAKTHHGSMSKAQRFEVEDSLRNGNLRLLCATSSMELGIDVGDIDRVFQIGCPRTISSTMQRLGRAGHNPGRASVMHMFPRTSSEGLYCGMTAKVVRDGGIERSKPPSLCLDVLAQHLVSMATGGGYHLDDVMAVLTRAYPFRHVTKNDVRDVLGMLAGDYEHERDLPVRPRVLYDRIHDHVEGDPYSRMLAISTGGTIPDRGLYTLKTENGVKIGELDEEFVYETRTGDRFLLGTFAWQVVSLQKDAVIVRQTNPYGARVPFWKGDWSGREFQTGLAFGKIFRDLSQAQDTDALLTKLHELGLDDKSAQDAKDLLERQISSTHFLPNDRTIVVEHFRDETNGYQMMVHSIFGRQINAPLSLLAGEAARKRMDVDVFGAEEENGFLLYTYDGRMMPQNLLYEIPPDSAKPVLEALLPTTSLFNVNFRHNANRALMMGVRKAGRQPLWIQRMRGAQMMESLLRHENHPLIRETKRECLEDHWDLTGVEYVLSGIQSGLIKVYEMVHNNPSPMTLPLQWEVEANMMYDYSPTTSGIRRTTEESLRQTQMIEPASEELNRVSERNRLPKDEKQLHSLLMMEGDLVAGELDVPIEWLELLAGQERAHYIEPGLWIAAEHIEEYTTAFQDQNPHNAPDSTNDSDSSPSVTQARLHIVRRHLRYRGAKSLEQIGERYLLSNEETLKILTSLCEKESLVENDGLYYHSDLYNKARRETIKSRRRQIQTLPPERYASLLTNRLLTVAPPEEQLKVSLQTLCDQPYPPEYWESILLPRRVSGYRPSLLDALLTHGEVFWRMAAPSKLSFHLYEDIDWDADVSERSIHLEGNEAILYEALQKRGASFMQGLSNLLDGVSPYDTLLALMEKGLAYADSFTPVRQWLDRDKIQKAKANRRIHARMMAMSTGRWELSRPLVEPSITAWLERMFDRVVILSRETIQNQGLSWGTALETLRTWEYTGYVRRGYFIEGLSGAQFIRDKDFTGTMLALEQPSEEVVWLSAVDPAVPWGKTIPHKKGKSYLNVPGTVVALYDGIPVAVFEQQGKVLRVFEDATLSVALRSFVRDYENRRVFPNLKRLTVKQYPEEAVELLTGVGFLREMRDYVLYRKQL